MDIDATWAKVPQDRIRESLRYIPNRGRIGLAAVKVYIILLAMRNNLTCSSSISYAKIHGYTNVRLADIRMALNILITGGFLNIRPSVYSDLDNHTYNEYVMLGDFEGKKPRHRRPHKAVQIVDGFKELEDALATHPRRNVFEEQKRLIHNNTDVIQHDELLSLIDSIDNVES